jgi:hypothetical protein
LLTARAGHTASELPDGRVLIAGGETDPTPTTPRDPLEMLASAEIYDPSTGGWTAAPPIGEARSDHEAVAMTDSRVLLVGGWIGTAGSASASTTGEVYDPTAGAWTTTSPLIMPRADLSPGVLLHDGRVLLAGGMSVNFDGARAPMSDMEILDPTTLTWSQVAPLQSPSAGHTASILPDGRVLLAGTGPVSTHHRATLDCQMFRP